MRQPLREWTVFATALPAGRLSCENPRGTDVEGNPDAWTESPVLACSLASARPGSPGRLLAQGSHGSGRARLAHPAPRLMGSLRDGRPCARRAAAEVDKAHGGARTTPTTGGLGGGDGGATSARPLG